MRESDSEQFGRLKPYIADMIATAGAAGSGGTSGGGAVATSLLAAHVAAPDPHTDYRLESVPIPLATDVTGVLLGANGGTGVANTGKTLAIGTSGTAVVGTGTATYLGVWTGANVQTGYAALKWDNANLALLVGRATTVTAAFASFPTNDDNVVLQLGQDNAVSTSDSYGVLQFTHAQQGNGAIIGSLFWVNREIVGSNKLVATIDGGRGSAVDSGYIDFWTMNGGTLAEAGRISQHRVLLWGKTSGLTSAGAVDIAGNLNIDGTFTVAGATLTVPTTGTAALLAVANVFTAVQTISVSAPSVYPFFVESDQPTADGAAFGVTVISSAAAGRFFFARAQGTKASPTAVASGNRLFTLDARGWDGGSPGAFAIAAQIHVDADGAVTSSPSAVPGRIKFLTADATGTLTEAMRITKTQSVLIGKTSGLTGAGDLDIQGNLRVTGNSGFYGTTPIAKPTVTGSRGGNAALANFLTALASQGLITDSTTA